MRKRILVVDDDLAMLGFVCDVLSDSGNEVVCASGGQEAIEILEKDSFDCVVLEFYMPERDGLDVVASMYDRGDRTPTIIFTSSITPRYEAAVQGFGVVKEILKKPCSPEKLLKTVERVIQKRQAI